MDTFFWFFWGSFMSYAAIGWILECLRNRHRHTWTMWEQNFEGSQFQHRNCETCGLREERRVY